jgi:hypothetical protein
MKLIKISMKIIIILIIMIIEIKILMILIKIIKKRTIILIKMKFTIYIMNSYRKINKTFKINFKFHKLSNLKNI